MSAIRQRAQTPAGSKYFVALSDLSGSIYQLSDSQFIKHTSLYSTTSTTTGTVMVDMGKTYTNAQLSSVSAGTVYHQVKFVGARFASVYSAPATYVEIVGTNGNASTAGNAGFGRIARLG